MKQVDIIDRENAENKNNTRYLIIAVFVFAGFLAIAWMMRTQRQKEAVYDVVVFGDSLIGLYRDETSVTALLEECLGCPVYNAAFGGTCMAVQDDDPESNYTMSLLNMVSLSKALAADDFGAQRTVRSRREITDYYEEVIDMLPGIDFSQAKTIVIAYGLNDYHAGIPLDAPEDPYDEETFGGAFRSVLRTLKDTYPQAQILVMTPTYTWYLSNDQTCEEYDTGGAFLEAYVEKELEIAAEFDIPAVDLYHEGYEHTVWEDWSRFTTDGLHPNGASRQMIAGRLAAAIAAGDAVVNAE